MKKAILISMFFLCSIIQVTAQQTKPVSKIRQLKIEFLNNELNLTADQKKQFWPIFKKYEKQGQVYRRGKAQIRKKIEDVQLFENMSIETCNELTKNLFEYDEALLENKMNLIEETSTFLTPKQVIKIYHAEYYFNMKVLKQWKKTIK